MRAYFGNMVVKASKGSKCGAVGLMTMVRYVLLGAELTAVWDGGEGRPLGLCRL